VVFRFSDFDHAHQRAGSDKNLRGVSSRNPAAGFNGQGARTIGRMDAIRNRKTMAGSPDAGRETFAISVSQSCAWSFRFGVPAFVNP
jgi:hypothetical protein